MHTHKQSGNIKKLRKPKAGTQRRQPLERNWPRWGAENSGVENAGAITRENP